MGERENVEMLAAECRIFSRYLLGADAPRDVVSAYQRAHDVGAVATGAPRPIDRALMRVALWGPVFAQAADGYAATFSRASLLRRKLVLLLAILESRRDTPAALDTAVPGSRATWVLGICVRAVGRVLVTCLAALLIAPLWAWYRVIDGHAA